MISLGRYLSTIQVLHIDRKELCQGPWLMGQRSRFPVSHLLCLQRVSTDAYEQSQIISGERKMQECSRSWSACTTPK